MESVERNHGYFIARYEASYGSGSTFGVGNDSSYYKPASKKTTSHSGDSMSYVAGRLWNFVTQPNAAKAGRQMYYGNSYIESDLINSYMWDTALLYIQAMGNTNYANKKVEKGTLNNTGATGDEKCHIFDMASNLYEWTTEYNNDSGHTRRGSYYNSSTYWTASRYGLSSSPVAGIGFRVGLWLKGDI